MSGIYLVSGISSIYSFSLKGFQFLEYEVNLTTVSKENLYKYIHTRIAKDHKMRRLVPGTLQIREIFDKEIQIMKKHNLL